MFHYALNILSGWQDIERWIRNHWRNEVWQRLHFSLLHETLYL